MNYKNIWDKVLNSDEQVKYEFSVGPRYRTFVLVVWIIIALASLNVSWKAAVVLILVGAFHHYYLKVANAYAFTDRRVLIHKGWLSTKATSVTYEKITDVSVIDPLLSRLATKTGTLKINTAGSTGDEIEFNNVANPYDLKKRLDTFRK